MTEDFKLSYTVKDVMRRTSLSHATIYRAIGDGRLKAVKCGKRTLVKHVDLEAFISSLPSIQTNNVA
tara:strand:+ start:975 stop:1175 length:201 start_codon:yes stop_codon:yes gene_type:complete